MAYIRPFRGKWRAEVDRHGQRVSKVVDTEEEAKLWAEFTKSRLDASAGRYKPRDRLAMAGPDLVTIVPKTVLDACRELPHSQHAILEASIPTTRASGIYFLLRGPDVVYVGQSVDVLHRIARHRREGKKFDAFSYLECDPSELDRLEWLYIKAFVPEENQSMGNRLERKRHPGTGTLAPLVSATGGSEA